MNASRQRTSRNNRFKTSVSQSEKHVASRASKVLAERNQAVVAVGAWVEGGQDFLEHPAALALITEEIQAEKRRENEQSLQRFQDEVRYRVAHQVQVSKMRRQPLMKPDNRIHQVWSHRVSDDETLMSADAAQHKVMGRGSHEAREGMRQIRLRLASCRMSHPEEMESELLGGRHNAGSHVPRAEQEVEEKDAHRFTSRHACSPFQQKCGGTPLECHKSQPEPGVQDYTIVPRILWPLPDPDEVKRQRQSQFLLHRRLCMNSEREQVKENKEHRKHLKKTASIKAEKEQMRVEEERRLQRERQLAEARQRLEDRELLVLQRLKLEEEERSAELQRRTSEAKGKEDARFIEALRARMKERLSQERLELPPLCFCASSFWDSHPDTCANNCIFHNNPKEYAKALHSTVLSLDY